MCCVMQPDLLSRRPIVSLSLWFIRVKICVLASYLCSAVAMRKIKVPREREREKEREERNKRGEEKEDCSDLFFLSPASGGGGGTFHHVVAREKKKTKKKKN